MNTYKQDPDLPSRGKRNKADNVGTIRVRITRETGYIITMEPEAFDLYLNINPVAKTYNATVEYEVNFGGKKNIVPVVVPDDVIEDVIKLTGNKTFMSLNSGKIFPELMVLDGNEVRISVKTDAGNVTLDGGLLEDTLWNGEIAIKDNIIQTPFDRLAAIAFNFLGIEPEPEIDEDVEE